ncbi:MAG: glycoside hydrolase family 88 protein [Bacteroidales bacterium]|nr:glycoside hydrolase family 88 protein [Bacteroidales bacterium]
MKHSYLLILFLVPLLFIGGCKDSKESMDALTDRVFTLASTQYPILAKSLPQDKTPRTLNENGGLVTADIGWWCSGFFPGNLWLVYEYTGDEALKDLAIQQTHKLDSLIVKTKTDHDIGFQLNCSFGNALRLTGDNQWSAMLHEGAKVLAARFSPTTGVIRSWNHNGGGKWEFPVIIDNMMNLELLMRFGDDSLKQIALTHARTTIKNHFRPDGTSYHLVDYDPETGAVRLKQTVQGLSDDSAWARGNAWGLYGYTMMYELSKEADMLSKAEDIARTLLPKFPEDGIPFWDFDSPDIPNDLRDASAGAIIASALIKLSTLTADSGLKGQCLKVAEQQLRTLASPEYLAAPGELCGFLLKHSVGHKLAGSEVDVPLTYADYYFLEALLRFRSVNK